jgi:outer membrane murein-binding lipoprotein Lpp
MGQDPNTIRREIEETRSEIGETVEALGYKADVRSRMKNDVVARRRRVIDRIKEPFVGVAEHTPSAYDIKQTAGQGAEQVKHTAEQGAEQAVQASRQAVGMVRENPLGLVIGASALGFIAGLMAPTTRIESEKLGEASTQLKDRAKEAGQEVLERGGEVVQETVQSAKDTAKQAAQEQAEEMRGNSQDEGSQDGESQVASESQSAQQSDGAQTRDHQPTAAF